MLHKRKRREWRRVPWYQTRVLINKFIDLPIPLRTRPHALPQLDQLRAQNKFRKVGKWGEIQDETMCCDVFIGKVLAMGLDMRFVCLSRCGRSGRESYKGRMSWVLTSYVSIIIRRYRSSSSSLHWEILA
jgi:hypothetical protein